MNTPLDIDEIKIASLKTSKKVYDLMLENAAKIKASNHFVVHGSLSDMEKVFERGLPNLVAFFFDYLSQDVDHAQSLVVKEQSLSMALDVVLRFSSLNERLRAHPLLAPSCLQSLKDMRTLKENIEKENKRSSENSAHDFFEHLEKSTISERQYNMCLDAISAGGVCATDPTQLFDCVLDIVRKQALPYSETLASQCAPLSPAPVSSALFKESSTPASFSSSPKSSF